MARAFGATLGVGATDIVSLPCASALTGARTIHIKGFRSGSGDGSLGRYFQRGNDNALYLDPANTALQFEDYTTPTDGLYSVPLPTDLAWTTIVITHTVGSTPAIYFDGTAQTVTVAQAASGSPTSASPAFDIGNRSTPTVNRAFGGALAEFAVWDRILSAAEIASLAAGLAPSNIMQGLLVYAPLIRDVVDLKGNGAATVTGGAAYPHPRVFMGGQDDLRGQAAAGGGAVGTLTQTLGALTVSSVGSAPAAGSLAKTLGAVTLAAAGSAPAAGSLAATLAALTVSGVGSAPAAGSLAQTLAALTISSVGSAPVTGTGARTLAAVTVSAAGSAPVAGTGTQTLAAATLASTGVAPVTGTLAQTLGALTVSSAGSAPVAGTLAQTLAPVTLAGVGSGGTLTVVGTLSQTLSGVALAAVGSAPASGGLAQTLSPVGLVGAGSAPASGTLAQTLAAVALNSSGSTGLAAHGTLSVTLAPVGLVSVGQVGQAPEPVAGLGLTVRVPRRHKPQVWASDYLLANGPFGAAGLFDLSLPEEVGGGPLVEEVWAWRDKGQPATLLLASEVREKGRIGDQAKRRPTWAWRDR